MKAQEYINQKKFLNPAIDSNFYKYVKQPALIVTRDFDVLRANQEFYNFFQISGSLRNLGDWIDPPKYDIQLSGITSQSLTLNHHSGKYKALITSTNTEHEYLLLIDAVAVSSISSEAQEVKRSQSFKEKLILLEQISGLTIIHINLSNDSIDASSQFLKTLDLKEKDAYTINDFFKHIHPEDKFKAEQNYYLCKRGKECEDVEIKLISADKRLHYFNLKFSRVEDEQKCLLVIQDISSQKMLEMALRDNEALFRGIFEQAAVGIAQVSSQGNLLMYNQKLCDILGYQRDELMAIDFLKFTHPKDVDYDIALMNDFYSNKLSECIYEKRFLHKSGRVVWAKVHITVIRNEHNNIKFAVGIIDDISERKDAEQQILKQNEDLIRLNNEMDNFVYRTSHDLRAPLASVLGLVQLIKNENLEEQKELYMKMIEQSIRRLDNSIHEILELSRNSRMDVEYKNISLPSLVNNILGDLAHIKGYDKIDVVVDFNDEDFFSDEKRLKMIFNNLLSNAVNYHNPYNKNPFIKISGKVTNNNVNIKIEDNGMGIEAKHMNNIYKMFYRANDTIAGSGLGLYIVKEAIEKLKGTIDVNSQLGEGTCFDIIIPNHKQKIKS